MKFLPASRHPPPGGPRSASTSGRWWRPTAARARTSIPSATPTTWLTAGSSRRSRPRRPPHRGCLAAPRSIAMEAEVGPRLTAEDALLSTTIMVLHLLPVGLISAKLPEPKMAACAWSRNPRSALVLKLQGFFLRMIFLQVETIAKDPILECVHKNEEKCHYTYVTQFVPTQEEVCEENFEKTCQITFKQQAVTEKVRKCYKPQRKVCNGQGPTECRTVYESSCSTRYIEKQPGIPKYALNPSSWWLINYLIKGNLLVTPVARSCLWKFAEQDAQPKRVLKNAMTKRLMPSLMYLKRPAIWILRKRADLQPDSPPGWNPNTSAQLFPGKFATWNSHRQENLPSPWGANGAWTSLQLRKVKLIWMLKLQPRKLYPWPLPIFPVIPRFKTNYCY